MDDGTRISETVELFLRSARGKDVIKCAELLQNNKELLNSVEAGGFGALHFAAFNGDTDMLHMLLSHHPIIDLVNYDDNTPLVMAVKGHQLEAMNILIAAGADVNKASPTGATAAHHAAAMGFVDCLRLLAKHNAQLEFSNTEAGSLLHWACHSGDVNCVGAVLYEFNINIDATDAHGGTALLTALFMNKLDVIEFLLEHGASVNVCITEDGTTPLHIAVEHGSVESVKLLCAFGAHVQTVNADNESALDVAARLNKTIVIKELKKVYPSDEAKKKEEAARAKEQGNKVFAKGENVKAAKFYTLAIHYDNSNHVYFSNRAACYYNQRRFWQAYWDAWRCVSLNPTWIKGYLRKSVTEIALKKYNDAIATATKGLQLDPRNKELTQAKEEAFKLRGKEGELEN